MIFLKLQYAYCDVSAKFGQTIQHHKNGEMVGVNGEYYMIGDLDTTPLITKDEVLEIFKYDMNKEGLDEIQIPLKRKKPKGDFIKNLRYIIIEV